MMYYSKKIQSKISQWGKHMGKVQSYVGTLCLELIDLLEQSRCAV